MKQIVNSEILIAFILLFCLSNLYYLFFERTGMILVLLVGCVFIYLSRYLKEKLRGLILFWLGIIILSFGFLSNPYTLIVLFSFLVIVGIRYMIYKSRPMKVIQTAHNEMSVERLSWFSFKVTPPHVYLFEDMHIQHAIGDLSIDLTNAAHLQSQNLIIVRTIIGKTTITVPYHYQVKVDYTSLYGQLHIEDTYTKKLRNERMTYQTLAYDNGVQIKIFASSIIGDLEVRYR